MAWRRVYPVWQTLEKPDDRISYSMFDYCCYLYGFVRKIRIWNNCKAQLSHKNFFRASERFIISNESYKAPTVRKRIIRGGKRTMKCPFAPGAESDKLSSTESVTEKKTLPDIFCRTCSAGFYLKEFSTGGRPPSENLVPGCLISACQEQFRNKFFPYR